MPSPDQTAPDPSNSTPPSYDLATPEETAMRRRRRRWLVGGLAATFLVGLGGWGAHPLAGGIKAWQARRTAAEALRLLDASQPAQGVSKLQDALALRGTDPAVERAAAVFLTRVGHGREAVGFWKQVEKARALTCDEQRDFATDLLESGDATAAATRGRLAWPEGTAGTPADWVLGMRVAARNRDVGTADMLAKRLLDPKMTGVAERQRLDAALLLLAVNGAEDRTLGERTLRALADGGKSAESLEALLLLLRQTAQTITAERERKTEVPAATVQALLDLAGRVERHPLARTPERLAASQARIVAQPDQRARLIQEAVVRYGHSQDDGELAALAAWLYAQGEFQQVLAVLPPARATGSRGLYLQYLDALGSTGKWEEIRRSIESQRFSLDPMVEQMYLARCATEMHQPEIATLRWNGALRAAGTNPDKLLSLGRYAQGDGAPGAAEMAFRAAVKAAPGNRAAHEALLQLLQTQGRTADARQTLKEMLDVFPGDSAARNDYAYLGALLGQDLPADRDTARELVRAEPDSLPHRVTLALAELRLGHGLTALDAIKAVPPAVMRSQARFAAVDAAIRWDTGFNDDARQEAAGLTQSGLLPEEWALIQPITADTASSKAPN